MTEISEVGADVKWRMLLEHLRGLDGVVVAFSGGVDSSLLLAAAFDALGDRALAVTARSPSYPAVELEQAEAVAASLGARHLFIDSGEMDDPRYTANPPERCYHCKRALLGELIAIAQREGLPAVLDGCNRDDRRDYRPGREAAAELGVRSPLDELGLGKEDVRRLARERGLPNWEQPARACLASRIPYGRTITAELLRRVGAAEQALLALGLRQVRVRDHGRLASIELGPAEMERAVDATMRRRMVEACKGQGYTWVCLDLEGYRTGSMNEALASRE